MNKIAIPAILTATVMVAGMFAFMPVEQASTVHTSTAATETQTKLIRVASAACTIVDANGDGDCNISVNIAAGTPAIFRFIEVMVVEGADTAGDTFNYDPLDALNGVQNFVDPADNVADIKQLDVPAAATGTPIVGAGAGTITGTLVIAGEDGGDVETIQVWMTFQIPGDAAAPIITLAG